jgi:hypothetical protein
MNQLTNFNLQISFQPEDSFLESVFSSAVVWLNVGGLSVLVPLFQAVQRALHLLSPDRYIVIGSLVLKIWNSDSQSTLRVKAISG